MSTYNYSIASDTANAKVDTPKLSSEIQASSIVPSLDRIDTDGDSLTIVFGSELSSGEETTLTGLVGAHDGEPVPEIDLTRTSEGHLITAPTFEYDFDLDGYFQGYLYTASAGVTSIFDELITTEIKLRAGWYEILDNNAAIGDYIDFSVVDKDDVLGLFGALGLTQGVDVLEVGNFVRTEYINPRNTGRSDFRVDGASTVFAGLYFRIKYVSTGANDVDFKVSYLVYED